jgi:C4-type Zn-finger protein
MKGVQAPMSEVKEFFRTCPSCGRRFQIRLVSKKLVGERKDVEQMTQGMVQPVAAASFTPIVVEESVPLTIDVEDFQYSYRCKHCGHQWTEMHETESRV